MKSPSAITPTPNETVSVTVESASAAAASAALSPWEAPPPSWLSPNTIPPNPRADRMIDGTSIGDGR